jgi:hypothetical protein
MRMLITLVLAAICAFVLVVGLASSFARQEAEGRRIELTSPAGTRTNQRPAAQQIQPLRVRLPLTDAIRVVLERSQGMGS